MQLNNPKSNTSNLIKQSELAKRKARRRLIGSIFMLFTALIILLNVTAKVKPIPVTPKVIEIGNEASLASAPTKQLPVAANAPITDASSPVNASSPVSGNEALTNPQDSESAGNGFKAGVVTRGDGTNQTPSTEAITLKPIIITMNIGHKPSPEDILNGNTNSTLETIYYIQIATSQNKAGLQTVQNNLASSGIKSFVQNAKNSTYRLRAGPFRNKNDANDKLAQIQKSLNQ
jgi:cell division septation protein DedD